MASSRRIKLKKNQTTFPLEMFLEDHVINLEIIGEGLELIPDRGWDRFSNLQSLIINAPNVVALPASILSVATLKIFKLKNLNLSSQKQIQFNFPHLEILEMSHCHLLDLPQGIEKSLKLKELYLQGNSLSTLPLGFEQLRLLKRINIDSNSFSEIPLAILKLKSNLSHLSIDSNPLSEEAREILLKELNIW